MLPPRQRGLSVNFRPRVLSIDILPVCVFTGCSRQAVVKE